jgi:4-diphosphocytidyl-2-C-methyl-D-erythritol kinase
MAENRGADSAAGRHPNLTLDGDSAFVVAFAGISAETLLAPLRSRNGRGRRPSAGAGCRDVLSVLETAPGATCFALFKGCRTAARAKKAISRTHPYRSAKTGVLR